MGMADERMAWFRHRLVGDADTDVRGMGDGGYTLALVGMMVIPLMVMVSFAVDLGVWYAQSSRIQRAADAAALAGVVWLPSTGSASTAAVNAARANGYVAGSGVTVSTSAISDTQYQVSIVSPASRFFSQVFNTPAFNLTRSAIAEFNKPIPLGSPANQFGNDVTPTSNPAPPTCPQYQPTNVSPCGPSPMLWSSINGPYRTFADGDPYTTKCAQNGSTTPSNCESASAINGAANALYKPEGYAYAIDVGTADIGRPLTVWIYDGGVFVRELQPNSQAPDATDDCRRDLAPFNNGTYRLDAATWRSNFTSVHCQAGDYAGGGMLELQVYGNDGSDLTVTYGTTLANCHLYIPDGAATATYKNKWVSFCTFTPTQSGIYPFRVRSSGIASNPIKDNSDNTVATSGSGINNFSFKIAGGTSATTTRLYALDNLSIFTNGASAISRFYLAEIGTEHKGKKLQIDLYDPGDGAGAPAFLMQVKAPPGGAPAAVPTGTATVIPATNIATACVYNSTVSASKGPATPTNATNCQITTKNANASTGVYNNGWLRVEIQISPNYSCTTDCWWTIEYNFGSGGLPTDRTVWSLNVLGDPVHLIQ